ncbi:putative unusual protein kinase regulating ubiquinone biosynthesis (AarF/ABC1/UbiB family) [Mycobacterium sp. MAA66]|uniref:ABC1 kinase family protein n=1 Tax=Mycobacterium sp. MAA66 TaxID=3156297 RepID=UPI0035181637
MNPSDNFVPRGRVRRTMPLAGFTARAAGGRLVAGLRERAGNDGAVERFIERTAERYTDLLGHSKGALMKLGQLLSMVDTGGLGTGGFAPYQQALTRLQASAPSMAPELVREILRTEFGSTAAYFADFTHTPIAAASIGQVHRAVLHDGRQVAVKIQYPGVADAIRHDLANTELVATFLRFATSASGMVFDPRDIGRELTIQIAEELDYRRETAMMTMFSDLYRGHPFIRVPEVIDDASTDRVITMTYLDGMDWTAARQADQDLKNTWAETILRFAWGNFRHANLLHADPHPGNYRFHPDGTVGFVDFGCVKILPEDKRRQWVSVVRNIIENNKNELRSNLVAAGFIAADSSLTAGDVHAFYAQVFYELIAERQPVTYTPDSGARTTRWLFGLDSANPLTRMSAPADYVFAPRVQQALTNICGGLSATLHVRSINDDMDGVAEPTTELGKKHHAWVRDRGLPFGLDHHDHP